MLSFLVFPLRERYCTGDSFWKPHWSPWAADQNTVQVARERASCWNVNKLPMDCHREANVSIKSTLRLSSYLAEVVESVGCCTSTHTHIRERQTKHLHCHCPSYQIFQMLLVSPLLNGMVIWASINFFLFSLLWQTERKKPRSEYLRQHLLWCSIFPC